MSSSSSFSFYSSSSSHICPSPFLLFPALFPFRSSPSCSSSSSSPPSSSFSSSSSSPSSCSSSSLLPPIPPPSSLVPPLAHQHHGDWVHHPREPRPEDDRRCTFAILARRFQAAPAHRSENERTLHSPFDAPMLESGKPPGPLCESSQDTESHAVRFLRLSHLLACRLVDS